MAIEFSHSVSLVLLAPTMSGRNDCHLRFWNRFKEDVRAPVSVNTYVCQGCRGAAAEQAAAQRAPRCRARIRRGSFAAPGAHLSGQSCFRIWTSTMLSLPMNTDSDLVAFKFIMRFQLGASRLSLSKARWCGAGKASAALCPQGSQLLRFAAAACEPLPRRARART